MSARFEQIRLLEAILFAASEPLGAAQLARHLPDGTDLDDLMEELTGLYANRGVNLVQVGNRWAFRSAPELAPLMKLESKVTRKLSRVAMETLAIIAYHQPVTRAEIEEIRGVTISKGTLDILLEANWIKPKGRRRTPGRPVTWGTSEAFLDHFGLPGLDALPGVDELKAAGLIDSRPAIAALGARSRLPEIGEIVAEPEEPGQDEDPLTPSEEEAVRAEVRGEAPEGLDQAEEEPANGQDDHAGNDEEEASDRGRESDVIFESEMEPLPLSAEPPLH